MFYNRLKNPEAELRFRGWSSSVPEQKVVFMHKPAPWQGHAPIVAPVLPSAPPDRQPRGALVPRIFPSVSAGLCSPPTPVSPPRCCPQSRRVYVGARRQRS